MTKRASNGDNKTRKTQKYDHHSFHDTGKNYKFWGKMAKIFDILTKF